VVYRDVTRQAKGLYRLKHVGALESGLAYLSRYNSGWLCHNPFGSLTIEVTICGKTSIWSYYWSSSVQSGSRNFSRFSGNYGLGNPFSITSVSPILFEVRLVSELLLEFCTGLVGC
jgi:hypothetical protein